MDRLQLLSMYETICSLFLFVFFFSSFTQIRNPHVDHMFKCVFNFCRIRSKRFESGVRRLMSRVRHKNFTFSFRWYLVSW